MSNQIVTFGCRLNTFESEIIKELAEKSKLDNTIIFNSCAVTKEAERQLRQSIRKAKREQPNAKIIVTGCAAQISPQLYGEMPEVDKVIGNEEKLHLQSYDPASKEEVLVEDIMTIKDTAVHLVEGFSGKSRAFLQVQNGCNHRCTFCIIPYGRGNNRSVPIGELVKQANLLVGNGYKEIVFTGVDITDYGKDLPAQPSFGQMVKRFLRLVPNLERLRLSSIDVAELDEEVFELITTEPRIMPHFHLSLQSGDNMILKRMKRRHNREQVIDFCLKAKKAREDVVFGADIIAGFPTETEEMFANSYDLIKELGIIHLHVFPYSERHGTPAARMPQVPMEVRKRRAAELRKLGEENLASYLKKQVGKTKTILAESNGTARADDFTEIRLEESSAIEEGKVYQSVITKATDKFLYAKLVD